MKSPVSTKSPTKQPLCCIPAPPIAVRGSYIPHYRYFFNGQEVDNEVYGEGAVLGYEFRQFDARTGRWWSVDPLADKYPGVSPYVFCNENPIALIDPSGAEVWKPEVDEKGNIMATAEPGDDIASFKKFMGPAYLDDEISTMYNQLSDGKINLTQSYGGVFQLMSDAINDARRDPEFEDRDNHNCWGASLALLKGKQLYGNGKGIYPWSDDGVGLNSSVIFDLCLKNAYTSVSQSQSSVGKTILRFGFPGIGNTSHGSIFMGVDKNGNEYTFTKNGWTPRPIICKVSQISWKYLSIQGINNNDSGYYNPR